MTTQARPVPTRSPIDVAIRWARENLFSSPANTLLTIVALAFVAFALFSTGRFVLVTAEWEVVHTNRRLFFIGRFPSDELWRVWVIIYVLSALAGASIALWTRISPRYGVLLGVLLVPVFLFIDGGRVALQAAGAVGAFAIAYGAIAAAPTGVATGPLARNAAAVAWLAFLPFTWIMLRAVDNLLWGGLLLTIILSVVGISASFPLGVLLALGRASTFPVVRMFCVGYIELIRGVPLITVLFMALFFLPLTIEPNREVGVGALQLPLTGYGWMELNTVLRAMAAITIFSSAYVAETVRGGLQAVPRGQVEAAKALGLGTSRILALIVLPQALRAVIPAMVGQFISLFKDTSLVGIVGLTELLATARQVTAQPAFIGRQAEVLLFIALIYWLVAFTMSRASQQLERSLGVGER